MTEYVKAENPIRNFTCPAGLLIEIVQPNIWKKILLDLNRDFHTHHYNVDIDAVDISVVERISTLSSSELRQVAGVGETSHVILRNIIEHYKKNAISELVSA